jgi:hypothetical protein
VCAKNYRRYFGIGLTSMFDDPGHHRFREYNGRSPVTGSGFAVAINRAVSF